LNIYMPDLRSFIDLVRRERPRDILDIDRRVSPHYETAAIVTKLEQAARFPIVFFHDVAGSRYALVSNVCGSQGRMALALGCPPRELRSRYAEAIERPVPPKHTKKGPAQEQVYIGRKVNLRDLPQLIYHQDDACQPYITAAIVAAMDPENGKTNLSFHRLMILNENTTTIFMARDKHLHRIYRKHEQAARPMPIAAFIGVHPACSLGALYTGESQVEEYDIIGGLLRSPLPLVKCATNDLCVPAEAEVVLEGEVAASMRAEEGPFGEFTGYATGTSSCPLFAVHALTCRNNPIFQDIVSGGAEHLALPLPGMETHLLRVARLAAPATTALRVAAPLTVFVSIQKQNDAEPERLIHALLASDIYVKHVVVVDSAVDIFDFRQMATAIAYHMLPDRDVVVKRGCAGSELDPSYESPNDVVKVGIDATAPHICRRSLNKNRIPKELLDSINLAELLRPS
jgi:2,5-furandicarboxylate decarboxylase 1